MTATTGTGDLLALLDHGVRPDPYPLFARMREVAPFRPAHVPVVVAASYADCAAVLRHPRVSVDRARSTLRIGRTAIADMLPPDAPASMNEPSFLFRDPPDHTRLRRLVASAFTPRVVEQLRPRIAELVDDALDRADAAGGLDLVGDLAYPLPVAVICELLGVSMDDEPLFRQWSALLARSLDPVLAMTGQRPDDFTEQLDAAVQLHRYFERLVEQRRGEAGDDLLSALIAASEAGDQLSTPELISTCGLLLIAGHETTVNLIANGALALLRDPAVLAELRADPQLGPAVVEETLRHDPPVQLLTRIATEPMDVSGMPAEPGDMVLLLLGAANRDPAAFPEPDRFDLRRTNRHLAFGLGPHFCVGAPLARLEATIALTRFAQRAAGPRLLADPPPYKDNAALRGPSSMPITFTGLG